MISKVIRTMDNLLPIEDTDHLRRLLFAVEYPEPDPAAVVDLPSVDAVQAAVDKIRRKNSLHEWMADPRTLEQRDADQDAAEWNETYNSLLP